MQKDFDRWNKEKKQLEIKAAGELIFREREIWWCSIGLNIGDEEDGKNELFERPVLVVRKFNKRIAWVIPMTTAVKNDIFHHVIFYDGKCFSLMLSQIRLLSVKRFRRYVRKLSGYQFAIIKGKLISLLG
ncbi:MAG: type II toxin-antitoxin system PemK/MazF family toxin [Patescibacteria group bacterium]